MDTNLPAAQQKAEDTSQNNDDTNADELNAKARYRQMKLEQFETKLKEMFPDIPNAIIIAKINATMNSNDNNINDENILSNVVELLLETSSSSETKLNEPVLISWSSFPPIVRSPKSALSEVNPIEIRFREEMADIERREKELKSQRESQQAKQPPPQTDFAVEKQDNDSKRKDEKKVRVRQCWQCMAKIVNTDGCNKMTCQCGATLCYLCRTPNVQNGHFYDTKMKNEASFEHGSDDDDELADESDDEDDEHDNESDPSINPILTDNKNIDKSVDQIEQMKVYAVDKPVEKFTTVVEIIIQDLLDEKEETSDEGPFQPALVNDAAEVSQEMIRLNSHLSPSEIGQQTLNTDTSQSENNENNGKIESTQSRPETSETTQTGLPVLKEIEPVVTKRSATVKKELTPLQSEFVSSKAGYKYIQSLAEEKYAKAYISVENQCLLVNCENQQISDECADYLIQEMPVVNIELDEAMKKIWNEKSKHLLLSLHSYCVSKDKSTLSLIASKNELANIKDKVVRFFKQHTIYKIHINECPIFGHYLKKYSENDLKKEHGNKVDIQITDEGQLIVEGNQDDIDAVKQSVKMITNDLCQTEYEVTQPGMSNYFYEGSGLDELNTIATRTHTVILTNDRYQTKENKNVNPVQMTVKLQGVLHGKVKLLVIHGDITAQNVDAIVNITNEDLQHSSGLAAAIVALGGQEIQTECTKHIKDHSCLKVSDTFVSCAGQLSCKKILHVVGPHWHGGQNNEAEDLQVSMYNIFFKAEYEKFHSIAVPAISAEAFGFPPVQAIEIIVNAINDVCRISECIQEVRLIDNNSSIIENFVDEVKKLQSFTNHKNTEEDISALRLLSNGSSHDIPIQNENIDFSTLLITHQNNQPEQVQDRIKLHKDSIINVAEQCDVIVNSTAKDNLLGGGKSSDVIKNRAGQLYIDDVTKKYPKGFSGAEIAITCAGNLGCGNIFHISCPPWDPNKGATVIKNKVTLCLDELNNKGLASIAFPAIGTGGLQYPADIVASAMFAATVSWFNHHPSSSVRSVHFVTFQTDTQVVQAFDSEYKKQFHQLLTPDTRNDSSLKQTFNNLWRTKSDLSLATKIGQIAIEIVKGDITDQRTDCIICPTNAGLELQKFAVSQKLKSIAKPGFNKMVNQMEKNFQNGILPMLTFNTVPFNCILFVNIHPPQPDVKGWQYVFKQSLKIANKKSSCITSVAVPVLGISNMDRSSITVVNSIKKMLEAIQSLVTKTKNLDGNLRLIRIVAYEQGTYDAIQQYVSSIAVKKQISTPSVANSEKNISTEVFEPERNLTLFICGLKSATDKALIEIDKVCKDRCQSQTISTIGLDDETINVLKEEADAFGLHFNLVRQNNLIILNGQKAVECASRWKKLLFKEPMIDVDKEVTWHKRALNSPNWQLINKNVQRLENGYRAWKNRYREPKLQIKSEDDENVLVDFEHMTVMSPSSNNVLYNIKRRASSLDVPVEWKSVDTGIDKFNLETVDPSSDEYCHISKAVFKSLPVKIQQIQRVENYVRYRQYALLKNSMEQRMTNKQSAEMRLFHGTLSENIRSICQGGFNRSLAGENVGHIYGKGSYFARDFKYSSDYGKSTVFYANVLTGLYTKGHKDMKMPPIMDAAKGTRFDSVVDNEHDPSIFVVFSDNHAYPSYLITYSLN